VVAVDVGNNLPEVDYTVRAAEGLYSGRLPATSRRLEPALAAKQRIRPLRRRLTSSSSNACRSYVGRPET